MLKSILVNKNDQIWLLIGLQQNHLPTQTMFEYYAFMVFTLTICSLKILVFRKDFSADIYLVNQSLGASEKG